LWPRTDSTSLTPRHLSPAPPRPHLGPCCVSLRAGSIPLVLDYSAVISAWLAAFPPDALLVGFTEELASSALRPPPPSSNERLINEAIAIGVRLRPLLPPQPGPRARGPAAPRLARERLPRTRRLPHLPPSQVEERPRARQPPTSPARLRGGDAGRSHAGPYSLPHAAPVPPAAVAAGERNERRLGPHRPRRHLAALSRPRRPHTRSAALKNTSDIHV